MIGMFDIVEVGLMIICLVLVVLVVMLMVGRRGAPGKVTILSSVEHMRSIGQLSVFKAFTKEIVTETDHSWGDFGQRYLGWVVSEKKMAMIFEFEIDFRYDLRDPHFAIMPGPERGYSIAMPPCLYEVHIRNIRFYDEQRSKFMPWLLPDLLNGFLAGGFSEADRNRLVDAAREHAQAQARHLIGNLQGEVQTSAKATLRSISKAFGSSEVSFEFATQPDVKPTVQVAPELTEPGRAA